MTPSTLTLYCDLLELIVYIVIVTTTIDFSPENCTRHNILLTDFFFKENKHKIESKYNRNPYPNVRGYRMHRINIQSSIKKWVAWTLKRGNRQVYFSIGLYERLQHKNTCIKYCRSLLKKSIYHLAMERGRGKGKGCWW